MSLEKYRQKRHFGMTPEPPGAGEGTAQGGAQGAAQAFASSAESSRHPLFFAVQKHAARRLHYDFRLELDGVLLSWAIPKGPSLDPRDRRLAARVEDHPLEYGSFEGTIPAGEYGAGTVELWDRGSWEPEGDPRRGLEEGDLKFTLHGVKLKGSWALVRMKPRPGQEVADDWLLIKHRDEFSVESDGDAILSEAARSVASERTIEEIAAQGEASMWHGDRPADDQTDVKPGEEFLLDAAELEGARKAEAVPRFVEPELATLVEQPPRGEGWLHEAKFDGYRILARIEAGSVKLYSRNEQDWTDRYDTLAAELARLPVASAMLDGELVMQLPDGTHSFQALQRSLARGDETAGEQLVYYVFDILHLNGYDLMGVGIEARKELLEKLLSRAEQKRHVLFSQHVTGPREAQDLLAQACRFGLEGVVSKKAGSRYYPGSRRGDWLKAKCRHGQEFVVGGFTDPAGSRAGFGALLLGAHENGGLRYVGKVGTGFDDRVLRRLAPLLAALESDSSPFTGYRPKTPKGTHWVRPELVAEVAFSDWTRERLIRHPSFKGLREDKTPTDISVETPTAVPASDPPGDRARGDAAPSDVARREAARSGTPGQNAVAGDAARRVALTHPDRVFWPVPGLTKQDLVDHYHGVADLMLPYVLGRPIAMVRCPDGVSEVSATVTQGRGQSGPCFFHKHPGPDFPGPLGRVTITESGGAAAYLTITEAASLTALAQMGVLEVHIWGSTWPDIEHPDMLVLDLDPDASVSWRALADGARLARDILSAFGLESYVKTTGGKGLHVVAPLIPTDGWQTVHDFSKAVAEKMVSEAPERYTATMSKAKRVGKIFVDYVRNSRGSTSVAPYSSRAKEQATVAVPLHWSELRGRVRPDTYTINNFSARLRRLRSDPWDGYVAAMKTQSLSPEAKGAAGLGAVAS